MGMSPQEIKQAVSAGKNLIDTIKDLVKSNDALKDAIKHNNALLIEHGRIMQKLVVNQKES